MKKIIWSHGFYAALVMVGMSSISYAVASGDTPNYSMGEIIGYATMVLCMVFVFLGIRNYRDQVNNGVVSFGASLKVGLLIALIPALAFGIMDQIYVQVINPDFIEEYYAYALQQIEMQSTPDEYQAAVQRMNSEREMFSHPLIQFLVMFLTVMTIGLIVSIISAVVLKRKRSLVTTG